MDVKEQLTVAEAAEKSGYCQEHIRRLIREKHIGAVKFGMMWWIDPQSLADYERERGRGDVSEQ